MLLENVEEIEGVAEKLFLFGVLHDLADLNKLTLTDMNRSLLSAAVQDIQIQY